jgi:hypothetical protein
LITYGGRNFWGKAGVFKWLDGAEKDGNGSALSDIDLAADKRTEQAPPRRGCAEGHHLPDP